jgi:lysophospholipase L1-like esterase
MPSFLFFRFRGVRPTGACTRSLTQPGARCAWHLQRLVALIIALSCPLGCRSTGPGNTDAGTLDPGELTGQPGDPNDRGPPGPLNPADPSNPNGQGTDPVVGGQVIDGLRFIGRVPPASRVLSWSGSAVEASFSGTQGSFEFNSQNGNSYIGIQIDGGALSRHLVQTGMPVSIGALTAGVHTVRATKLSEGRLGQIQFVAFKHDGTSEQPQEPARKLEFIGDSITGAYGIDGNAPCTNSAALENATASYAALTATALDSDASLISWSGKGIWRNDVTDTAATPTTMVALWQRYVGGDANQPYPFPVKAAPQAVVMMLGTNDYEYANSNAQGGMTTLRPAIDHTAFVAAYVAFVQQITARYPGANIILCSSPMLNDTYPTAADRQHAALVQDLQNVAAQVGGVNIAVLDFPALDSTQATGCGGHPNAPAHQAMADRLTLLLKQQLSW